MLKVWLPLNGDLHNQGLADVTVTNNGATINNSGKIGKCYEFGTTTNSLSVTSDFIKDISSGCSFAFWVKFTDFGVNYQTIFDINDGGISWNNEIFAFQKNGSTKRLVFTIAGNNGHTSASCVTQSDFELNRWYHFVCVYDPGKMSIYKDGEHEYTYNTTVVPKVSAVRNFVIGAATTTGTYQSKSLINDFRLYSHALSAKEIKEISKGLVLHYPLSDSYVEGTINLLPSNLQNFTETGVGAGFYSYNTSTHGSYTLSGYITCRSTDKAWTNPRVTLRIAYSDGTFTVVDDSSVIVMDGKERHFSLTATSNTSKTVTSVNGWILDHSSGTTGKDATIRCAQLEMKDHATPYTPSTRNENIVYDVSGYQNNGMITGSLTCSNDTPRYNVSTHIGATNQKIHISGLTTSGFGNSYSFAWWGKRSSNSPMFWGFSDGIRLNGMYIGNLWNTGDGSSNPLYNIGTTTQVTAPSTGIWHHYVMTGNGSKCYVYLDGELWAEAKTYKAISGTSIYINGWDSGTSYCSDNTSISDFRIYSTALDAEQVKALYHTPTSITNNGTLLTQGEISEV